MPMTDHNSPIPIVIAAPGRAKSNHADSPEALSENAVTHGPSFLPAKDNLLEYYYIGKSIYQLPLKNKGKNKYKTNKVHL